MKKILFLISLFLNVLQVCSQTVPPYEVVLSDTQASVGYYFLHAFKLSGAQSFNPSHMILDSLGNLVYIKAFSRTSSDFKLHPDGRMSYANAPGNPVNAGFYIMDSTFTVVDSVQCKNGILTDVHDLQILSNGNYLMLGFEYVTMDLSSYLWFSGNGSPGSMTASVKCGVIQELDENKNVVFTWRTYDHFSFGDVQEQRLFDPVNVDWTHCNAVGYDTDSNVLLSLRFFSEVTKINRQTGEIIWRMGGKQSQFSFVNDTYDGFYGQHDPRRISNGHITLFDNGKAGTPVHPARGVEYALDEVNHTATLMWSYVYGTSVTSGQMGNVHRVSNGNTVIGWGGIRNANAAFTCIKQDSAKILEVRFPDSSITYRVFNYPTLPWEFNRPSVTCFKSDSSYFLDAGAGYSSYSWSTGATTQMIQITTADTYYVFVPYGEGGYISSEKFIVTSLTNPCNQDSINTTTVEFGISNGWNLISLPVGVVDGTITSLFPSAVSQAFFFLGQYEPSLSMTNGPGYWLKFDSVQQIPISGLLRGEDTIDVVQGWNLIGSISTAVATSGITSIPGGIVTSSFFGYNSGYVAVDSIVPGKGYWVKVAQGGTLILSETGAISPQARIRIVPTDEMPSVSPEE